MHRQKRPFYIIGHDPNTLEEVKEYLDKGANALEPDIVFAEGRYYVCHNPRPSYENTLTAEAYLKQLKALLFQQGNSLALIIFDMKSNDFDPNHFMSVVKENFCGEGCDGVALLMTHSDDTGFINRYKSDYPNVGVGVDESDTPPYELEEIFKKGGQENFSYADGITTFLTKPGVYKNITEALQCRDLNEPESFRLIYTWVLSKEASMRKYLDIYIDGILVDPPAVERLKKLVTQEPYHQVYELARNGYNPFKAPPLPRYTLKVTTADRFGAGTDARILFTLLGDSGLSLPSLPYDASRDGALEKGSTDFVTIEGMEVGEISGLKVEMLTTGLNADWMPQTISVESRLLAAPVDFRIQGEAEHWITKKGGAVTLFPSRQKEDL